MTSKITRDVLDGYLHCTLKGHLKLTGQQGDKSEYESLLDERRQEVGRRACEKLLAQHPLDRVERGIALTPAVMRDGADYLIEAVLDDGPFQLRFDGLKRVDGKSKLGKFQYVPVLFHENQRLQKQQKLLLALHGLVLAELQARQPEFGIVWHGSECRPTKVQLRPYLGTAKSLLDSLQEKIAGGSAPPLILNDHCPACEFRQRCQAQAVAEDNLSLMRGVGANEIKSYRRKGIFTVSQLSHTFRPRRRKRGTEPGSQKRHLSLQAMAVRDKTIYVLGSPEIRSSPVKAYLDIEGDPDQSYSYLIGLVLIDGDVEKRFSFWADSKSDEQRIFADLIAALPDSDEFALFSYGSYETAFLKRMLKVANLKHQAERLLKASVNILSVIYAHIYFPAYTNGLKDVGSCLGCRWTEPNASGRQSLVWRARWEATRSDEWKQKLVQYNLEDCDALKAVVEQVYALAGEADADPTPNRAGSLRVAHVQETDQHGRVRKWGTVNFVHPDYAYVNGCAYFKYQRSRVYVQTSRSLRRNQPRTAGYRSRRLKVTRQVMVLASECENCRNTDLITYTGRRATKRGPRGKRAFDLVGSKGGIKLSVIQCRSTLHECRACGAVFVPAAYQRLTRYFHGVKSWTMYQHVAHGLSFGTIKEMIDVFFGLPVPKPELHRFKAEMAAYYEPTCRRLWEKLLAGKLLHVDETQLRLKGGQTSYIWAFTNLEEVVYVFRPNREGEFLHDLLKDFHGVLVSDFYAAYDSLDCPQQKCLIHLIRDMNDDLLDNPFDEELQAITKPFGALLRPIVSTIGEHGLRKWHLRRFKRDVAAFFRLVESLAPRSEAAEALRQRLLKYRSKLFTFLDYDGVPWNNNNAENAIKRFAMYRAHASGLMKPSGVEQFLRLLSVCQTCKYKGINFWKFLSSGKPSIDSFAEGKCPNRSTALEVYPEAFPPLWEQFRPPRVQRSSPNG